MKRICLVLIMICWVLLSINAQSSSVRVCTEEEIPASQRKRFLKVAENFLENYYNNLFLNINDDIVQESFINNLMVNGTQRYKPEFPLNILGQSQYLMPEQYLQELSKQFKTENFEEWMLEVTDITFDKDFKATNNLDCFVTAHYTLTLNNGENKLYSRSCTALCYWSQSRMYDQVRLMQVEPVKDIIAYNPKTQIKLIENKKEEGWQVYEDGWAEKTATDTIDNIFSLEDETVKAVFVQLSEDIKKQLRLKKGIQVLSVFEGRMKEAGCKKNFIILKANGNDINNLSDFERIMANAKASTEKVVLFRGIYPSGKRAYYAIDLN